MSDTALIDSSAAPAEPLTGGTSWQPVTPTRAPTAPDVNWQPVPPQAPASPDTLAARPVDDQLIDGIMGMGAAWKKANDSPGLDRINGLNLSPQGDFADKPILPPHARVPARLQNVTARAAQFGGDIPAMNAELSSLPTGDKLLVYNALYNAHKDYEGARTQYHLKIGTADDYAPAAATLQQQAEADVKANPQNAATTALLEGHQAMRNTSLAVKQAFLEGDAANEYRATREARTAESAARAGEHPLAAGVGSTVGAMVSPESLAAMAVTGGLVNPLEAGMAEDLAAAGIKGLAQQALVKGVTALPKAAGYMGLPQTAQQLASNQPGTPVENTIKALPMVLGGEVGGALSEGAVGKLPTAWQPVGKLAGGAAVGAGVNVGAGMIERGRLPTMQEAAQEATSGAIVGGLTSSPGETPGKRSIEAIQSEFNVDRATAARIVDAGIRDANRTAAKAAPSPAPAEATGKPSEPSNAAPVAGATPWQPVKAPEPPASSSGTEAPAAPANNEMQGPRRPMPQPPTEPKVATQLPADAKSENQLRQEAADKDAFDTLMHNQREQRVSTYTPERVNSMTGEQLRRAAEDLGVPYDAPSTTAARVNEAVESHNLDLRSSKELYDQAQQILRENAIPRVKAGNRDQNIAIIKAWNQGNLESYQRAPSPQGQPPANEGRNTAFEQRLAQQQEARRKVNFDKYRKQSGPEESESQIQQRITDMKADYPHLTQAQIERFVRLGEYPKADGEEGGGSPAKLPPKPPKQGGGTTHTQESLDAMKAAQVASLAAKMGIQPKAKAANIAAILERQKGTADEAQSVQKGTAPPPAQTTTEAQAPALPREVTDNPHLPRWVNESMKAAGKDPNRLLNEIDAARPDTVKQLANDPVTKFLEHTNPSEADRMKRGEMSAADYMKHMKAMQSESAHREAWRQIKVREDAVETLRDTPEYNAAHEWLMKHSKSFEKAEIGLSESDIDARLSDAQIKNDRAVIEQAKRMGKPVPMETLKEFPDLLEKYGTMPPAPVGGTSAAPGREGAAEGTKQAPARQAQPGKEIAGLERPEAEPLKPGAIPESRDDLEPKIEGFMGGPKKTSPLIPDAKPTTDQPPTARHASNGFVAAFQWLRRTFAPQTASPAARKTANDLRAAMGEAARNVEIAKSKLADAHWYFDGQPKEANQDFIDRFQAGEAQPTPELQKMADIWKSINRDQTNRMDALDPDMKRQWEEDHIKQVWKESANDPTKVSQVVAQLLAKRPLEGSKGFLKKKSYLTYAEGRAAGLTPAFGNPVDAMLYGHSEAEKYIVMRQYANQLIHSGVTRFIRAGEQTPDGYATVDDPAFTVYAPPTISVNEYVNKSVHEALQTVADKLGIRVKTQRTTPAMPGKLGYSVQGGNEVVRRFGTDIGVLGHEIGHQLDHKYGLLRQFNQPKYQEELRALTDLYEPGNAGQKAYVRRGAEKMAAMLDAYVSTPDSFRRVAPTVYRDFENFLGSHDELMPLAELERSMALKKLTTEIPRGGITKMGSYAMPQDMADVIGNHLSRGLGSNPIFRTYMNASGAMNTLQLAGAFHAGFTSGDSVISRNALAIEQLANGKPLKAVRSILTSPLAPITNAYAGHQLLGELTQPGSHPELSTIVNYLVEGGARRHQAEPLRVKEGANLVRAARQHDMLGVAAHLPTGTLDALNYPLMEKLVPMQKWGVMGDLMREELDRLGPNAKPEQIRDSARKVVDAVDNRMGQVVYDNLFMNRKAKDILMGSMRSVGWNLGTVKEVGGGIAQAPANLARAAMGQGLGHNTAYVMALLGTTAFTGAMYQYLKTGQYPQTTQDYFQPKTGRKDKDGNDIRVQLPTYMRDVMSAAHGGVSKVPGNLVDMAASKAAPLPAALLQLAHNKDYYGTQIANPDDSLVDRTKERGAFALKQLEPFSMQALQRQGEDVPMDERVGAMVGVTPTPKRFTESPAEEAANDLSRQKFGDMTRTQSQVDKSQLKNDLTQRLKANPDAGNAAIKQALADNKITDADAASVAKKAGMSPLEWHLRSFTPEESLKVWDQADADQRKQIEGIVQRKIANSSMPAAKQDELMQQHGITPPADLALDREHQALNAKAKADTDKQDQLDSLKRRITAAEQQRDWATGSQLRKQHQAIMGQPDALSDDQADRLKLLRRYVAFKNDVQKRMDEGSLALAKGAELLKNARANVAK